MVPVALCRDLVVDQFYPATDRACGGGGVGPGFYDCRRLVDRHYHRRDRRCASDYVWLPLDAS